MGASGYESLVGPSKKKLVVPSGMAGFFLAIGQTLWVWLGLYCGEANNAPPRAAGFCLCLLLVKKTLTTWVNVNLNKLICFCLPAIICSGCGEALTESEQRARKLTHPDSKLRFLAESGRVECQTTLAHCYCDLQQYKEAMKWYRAAARQGDASALNEIGDMYRFGTGVLQDDAEAVKWYGLAADQGLAEAQGTLGLMYANGEGVPQDFVEAYARFSVAATGDIPDVVRADAVRNRDAAASKLSPDQLAAAKKTAAELLEKYGSGN